MKSKILCLVIWLVLLSLPQAWAESERTRIAVLNAGDHTSSPLIAQGIVDALDAWGIVDRANYNQLHRSLEGERLQIESHLIPVETSLARAQISEIIDSGRDIIVATSAVLAQLTANATQSMEDPPVIVFVGVDDPYGAGLADSPCIKLQNVTGVENIVPYDDVMAILPRLDPSITTIGALFNASDPDGRRGAAQIEEIGEAMGLSVEVNAYTDFSTTTVAAEGLISKGIQALVLPLESGIGNALGPVLAPIAAEAKIPIIGPDAAMTYLGATIGVGNLNHYLWGINVGRLLVAHLQGELDIASAAISPASLALSVGINLSVAEAAGIEISPALMDEADFTLQGFQSSLTEKGKQNTWQVESMRALGEFLQQFTTPETYAFVQDAALPDLREGQAEFVESLRCTPERIAEEQAALNAGS